MATVYSVGQINSYIRNMFEQDFVLGHISIRGEISNCKYHTSGHVYFTLKDETGTLSAIMFAANVAKLSFRMENGMQVVVTGKVTVYARDGKYQLYAQTVEQDGIGDLYQKFAQLKDEYEQMGYFAPEYKRVIPKYAKRIGIVTAQTGAAIHDIMNISYRRNPYVQLILYPALVQGAMAKDSIVRGIDVLDRMNLDVIIVGRGGGSIEDLWAFNEPVVVEAIFNAHTPIISAVGHETDFTIADFVADMRAPTPSAAAELAVARLSDTEDMIMAYTQTLYRMIDEKVQQYRYNLNMKAMRLEYLNPANQVNEKRQYLLNAEERLQMLMQQKYKDNRHRLEMYASRLHGVSPLLKLSQGYAYIQNEEGKRISSVQNINTDDVVQIYVKDGAMKARIVEVTDGKGTDT